MTYPRRYAAFAAALLISAAPLSLILSTDQTLAAETEKQDFLHKSKKFHHKDPTQAKGAIEALDIYINNKDTSTAASNAILGILVGTSEYGIDADTPAEIGGVGSSLGVMLRAMELGMRAKGQDYVDNLYERTAGSFRSYGERIKVTPLKESNTELYQEHCGLLYAAARYLADEKPAEEKQGKLAEDITKKLKRKSNRLDPNLTQDHIKKFLNYIHNKIFFRSHEEELAQAVSATTGGKDKIVADLEEMREKVRIALELIKTDGIITQADLEANELPKGVTTTGALIPVEFGEKEQESRVTYPLAQLNKLQESLQTKNINFIETKELLDQLRKDLTHHAYPQSVADLIGSVYAQLRPFFTLDQIGEIIATIDQEQVSGKYVRSLQDLEQDIKKSDIIGLDDIINNILRETLFKTEKAKRKALKNNLQERQKTLTNQLQAKPKGKSTTGQEKIGKAAEKLKDFVEELIAKANVPQKTQREQNLSVRTEFINEGKEIAQTVFKPTPSLSFIGTAEITPEKQQLLGVFKEPTDTSSLRLLRSEFSYKFLVRDAVSKQYEIYGLQQVKSGTEQEYAGKLIRLSNNIPADTLENSNIRQRIENQKDLLEDTLTEWRGFLYPIHLLQQMDKERKSGQLLSSFMSISQNADHSQMVLPQVVITQATYVDTFNKNNQRTLDISPLGLSKDRLHYEGFEGERHRHPGLFKANKTQEISVTAVDFTLLGEGFTGDKEYQRKVTDGMVTIAAYFGKDTEAQYSNLKDRKLYFIPYTHFFYQVKQNPLYGTEGLTSGEIDTLFNHFYARGVLYEFRPELDDEKGRKTGRLVQISHGVPSFDIKEKATILEGILRTEKKLK